jgi:hypothetical protein
MHSQVYSTPSSSNDFTQLATMFKAAREGHGDELYCLLAAFPSILRLFHHRYWMRVWIIQEITVARTVRVLYGDQLLLWRDLRQILSSLAGYGPYSKSSNTQPLSLPVHLVEFHEKYAGRNRRPISLLEALIWSRPTQSTDPRDKIFAVLGLCHDSSTYVPVPNYKQPIESIITDISKKMMTLDRSLDYMFLRGVDIPDCQSRPEVRRLPSWACDWQGLWSGSSTLDIERRLLEGFKVTSYENNPILESSTTSLL